MELISQIVKTWQVGCGTDRQGQGGNLLRFLYCFVFITVIKATYCALVSTLEKMKKISQY